MQLKERAEEIDRRMFSYWKHFYRDVLGLRDWKERCSKRYKEEEIPKNELASWPEIKPLLKGSMVLDVGCGTGGYCIGASREGADVYGIDIDSKAIEICRLKASVHKLPAERFTVSASENLPFADNAFDFVYCNSVLEHVQDVKKTVSEMIRVVKKEGMIFIKIPDYRSFHEGHYKIRWIPKMPKSLARLYLRAAGRPPEFINSINYVTAPSIKKCLKDKTEIKRENAICGNSKIEKFFYMLFGIPRYVEFITEKK